MYSETSGSSLIVEKFCKVQAAELEAHTIQSTAVELPAML
jgi:hypothetical protein